MRRAFGDVLRLRMEWLARWSYRRRGLILRLLMSWSVGLLALSADERNYDRRFDIRGPLNGSSKITIITLLPSDFMRAHELRTNSLASLHEVTNVTDSYFWDLEIWFNMLERILSQNPKAVGITLWLGDNIGAPQLSRKQAQVFLDPRLIWSTSIAHLERSLTPLFAKNDQSNIGRLDLRRDDDGILRRMSFQHSSIPSFTERLTGNEIQTLQPSAPINFRGPISSFERFYLNDLMSEDFPIARLQNQYVLIGIEGDAGQKHLSPYGELSKIEVIANALDNHIENRWIKRFHFTIYASLLFFLALAAIIIINSYPQSVVLLFFVWMSTLIAALSVWLFDTHNIWLPAISPIVLLIASWIIFIGYHATKIEKINQELQQEQRSLAELEQLKNNFVSLISHDLKTPIAKIQAIVNRIQSSQHSPELRDDLKSLSDSSEELHKYIQSILKVLRVESREFKLNIEIADINELIEEAVKQISPLAQEKQIQLTVDLEPQFSAEFDTTLIREVIINLIENAIKYTPNGGRVSISSCEIEEQIKVEVKDTGVGIPPEEIDSVWRKFTRGKDQEMKTKGSGLGLYLVKYFIELHGGSVALKSQPLRGTTVSFTLPINTAIILSNPLENKEIHEQNT